MSMGLVAAGISAAGAIGGSLISANAAKKAGQGGPTYDPINIDELDRQTREASYRNVIEGLAREREFRPDLAQMRPEVDAAMLQRLRQSMAQQGDTQQLRGRFLEDLLGADETLSMPELERSPLMDAAYERAMAEMEMGGRLPRDVQNLVMRNAMASSPQGSMRDVTARDLGLTGMQLSQQRLAQAAGLGQFQTGVNQQQQALRNAVNTTNQQLLGQRRAERASGLGFLEDLGFRDFATAQQITAGTPLPMTGLDPASIADITIADRGAQSGALQQQQAMRAQAATNQANIMGNMFGALGQIGGQYAMSRAPTNNPGQ